MKRDLRVMDSDIHVFEPVGILSRFPRLRMAFLEGNCSWLPWWLWALDERWEKWADLWDNCARLYGMD